MSCSGRPSPQLLEVVRLLLAKNKLYTSLTRNQHEFKVKLNDLKSKEMTFFQKYHINFVCQLSVYFTSCILLLLYSLAEHCLSSFPESYEEVLSCTRLQTSMSSKETYTYRLARGQRNCLRALITRVEGISRKF